MTRLAILEAALDVGLGRRYGHTGEDSVDCVTFAEAVIQSAFPEVPWAGLHRDLMIQDPARPFSNVQALVQLGFQEVPAPAYGAWHYCQGWRSNGRGHCWLWWEPEAASTAPAMILEATNGTHDWYRPAAWPDRVRRFDAGLRLVVL